MKKPEHYPFTIRAVSVNFNSQPHGVILHADCSDPRTKYGRRSIYSRLTITEARALRDMISNHIAYAER